MKKLFITGILLFFIATTVQAGQTIKIGSSYFPPFIGEGNSKFPGYMVEIIKIIFEAEGVAIKYKILPKKRSLRMVKNNKLDAILPVSITDAPNFIFPKESLGSTYDTFYVKKGTKWRFVGINSLKNIRLGGTFNYTYNYEIRKYFNQNKNSHFIDLITGFNSEKRNLKKLINNRIDVLIGNSSVIPWEIQQYGKKANCIINRGTIGNEKKIYIAFSPAGQNSTKYAEIFSKGIQKLRNSGELKKILSKYNQKDWKPSLIKDKKMKVVFAQKRDIITLDPAMATDLTSFKAIDNIYEGLVRYKDNSTEIEPALAVSWFSSEDKKKWTFNLRKNVVFHDGTPFNADAVVYNFKRQLEPKHPLYRKDFGYADFTFKNVKEITAINDYTVEILLSQPYTPFLYNLAMPAASRIISPDALKKHKNNIGKNPVGTGPFQFISWKDKKLTLKKNKKYWNTQAYLDELVFLALDKSDLFKEFKSGKVNVLGNFNTETALNVESLSNGHLLLSPVMHVGYLAMNTEKEPFNNLDVRKAINYAIDKKNLINNIYKGFAIVSTTALPPSMWGHNSNIHDYEYDVKKAKALLEKAGYAKGFEIDFWILDKVENRQFAKLLEANLKKIGVTLKVKIKEPKTFFKGVKSGEHQLAKLNWYGDNGDPDNFLYVLFDEDNTIKGKASNRAFLKDKTLHTILLKAQKISDKQKRTELYKKAQERIRELAPWVHLYHKQQMTGRLEEVRGLISHPTGTVRFHTTWIDSQSETNNTKQQ